MTMTHRWQLLAILFGIGLLLYLLGPVLTPFAMAALLAYLGDPLVDRLQSRGLGRSAAVTIVFAVMTLLLLLLPLILIPLLEAQISTLVEKLPLYIGWIRERLMPFLVEHLGVDPELFSTDQIVAMLKSHWQQAGGIAATVIASVSKSGLAIIGWIMNLLLIPVVSFYFLRDWDLMIERVRELLPRTVEARVVNIARQSDEVLSAFLRGQIAVMLALGLIYSFGLWLAGLKLAFLIGMSAGLLSFVPYLGSILGVGGAVIAALVEHRDLIHVVYVLAVFGVGQTLEGFVLTPWLVGDRIGLHPVAVIFAILAGGQLFGFIGILLALPVTAVLMVVLRHVHEQYVASGLYREGSKSAVASDSAPASALDSASNPTPTPASDPTPVSDPTPAPDRTPAATPTPAPMAPAKAKASRRKPSKPKPR
ncbi:MAG: AI-2E family transporter [Xanthomonadales bacterium]|nr:AI-2E family transporter [Xanthomonadales bacterium]